jgi:hypothetical protein
MPDRKEEAMRAPISLLLLATALVAAPPGRAIPPGEVPTELFMPLYERTTLHYKDEISSEAISLRVESAPEVGEEVVRLRRLEDDSHRTLDLSEGARKLLDEKDSEGVVRDYSDHPPLLAYGARLRLGAVGIMHPKNYVDPITGGTVRWSVRIERRLEGARVPAAFYPKCLELRVRAVDQVSHAEVSNFRMTFAPGVGLIRERGVHFGRAFDRQLIGVTFPWDMPHAEPSNP